MRFLMATSGFVDVSDIFLVACSAFATPLEGKSRLRARVVGTAEAPFTLIRIEKFKNAALFLRLGILSTLIRHQKGAFRKHTLFQLEDFETGACFAFQDRRHFANTMTSR